jgi:uncharacterized protein YkwD
MPWSLRQTAVAMLLASLIAALFAAAAHAATLQTPDPLLPSASTCAHALDSDADASQQRRTMACLINAVRAEAHLSQLTLVPALNDSAAIKRKSIIRCDDFSHTACGKPLLAPFEQSGYLRGGMTFKVGENLAWGSGDQGTPLAILNAWLHSPEHRANLLTPSWTQQGLSTSWAQDFQGQDDAAVWVSQFGRVS